MIEPIRPDAVQLVKNESIPEEIIDIVNDLIVENIRGNKAVFTLKEVVKRARKAGVNIPDAYSKHWWDFEPLFREVGWEVFYDNPGYNETYDGYYEFTRP